MLKRPVISVILLTLALALPGIAPGAQQAAPVTPTKHQQTEKPLVDQVLVALTPDTVKDALRCFSKFETSTNQLQFSDIGSQYGTVRGLQQSLDSLRNLIDSQKEQIPILTDDSGLDPLLAVDLLDSTHRASTQSLMYAMMPTNPPRKELIDGLISAHSACDVAHDSLVKYLRASIAIK